MLQQGGGRMTPERRWRQISQSRAATSPEATGRSATSSNGTHGQHCTLTQAPQTANGATVAIAYPVQPLRSRRRRKTRATAQPPAHPQCPAAPARCLHTRGGWVGWGEVGSQPVRGCQDACGGGMSTSNLPAGKCCTRSMSQRRQAHTCATSSTTWEGQVVHGGTAPYTSQHGGEKATATHACTLP